MKLSMRYGLPFYLESKLIHKFGFAVDQRKYNDCITFVKRKPTVIGTPEPVAPGLSDFKRKELAKRCDIIVDFFPDPYNAIGPVRIRLHNMAQALKVLAERQYVLDYTEDNFPESYSKKA